MDRIEPTLDDLKRDLARDLFRVAHLLTDRQLVAEAALAWPAAIRRGKE